jgi:transcriptional regulator with XRE-family HTH domain
MPNINESAKAWQVDLAQRVGRAVQGRRKELKLTAQQLAERTDKLGYPVTRVAISKIESGQRAGKLDLAELIVLGEALGVPPVALIYPDLPDGAVEMLPGYNTSSAGAALWFSGERIDDDYDGLGRLLKLTRDRYSALFRARRQVATIAKRKARGEDISEEAWPRIDYEEHIEALERLIREIPGSVVADPKLSRWED